MIAVGDKHMWEFPVLKNEMFAQQRCCQKPGWPRELKKITDHIVESKDIGLH